MFSLFNLCQLEFISVIGRLIKIGIGETRGTFLPNPDILEFRLFTN